MQRMFYKVIDTETRQSACHDFINSTFVVFYPIKKWVKPVIGPLFVFKTRASAETFSKRDISVKIVRCRIKPSTEYPKYILPASCLFDNNIANFWNIDYDIRLYTTILEDTVFAREVFCLE